MKTLGHIVDVLKISSVHGVTVINLFHRNRPRYSVNIDLTYIPIESRDAVLNTTNSKQLEVKQSIEKSYLGVKMMHNPSE